MEAELPSSEISGPSSLGRALRSLVESHLHVATVDVGTLHELTTAAQVRNGTTRITKTHPRNLRVNASSLSTTAAPVEVCWRVPAACACMRTVAKVLQASQHILGVAQDEYGDLADAVRNISDFLGADSKLQGQPLARL
jgi:hypothetical protein